MKGIWFVAVASLVGGAALARTPKVDLTGTVLGDGDAGLAGARVYIHEAAPKDEPQTRCSSCYLDCGRSAQTDAAGRFRIEGLDAKLVFTVLAVAAGYENALVRDVDPARGEHTVSLRRRADDPLDSPSRIAGMIMDARGRPVRGAVVKVTGTEGARGRGAGPPVDPVGIADDQGRFVLRCPGQVAAVEARVDGPGVARKSVRLIPGKDHLIRMDDGVLVTGRLEEEGRPLAGAVVAMAPAGDTVTAPSQIETVATDEDGRFAIPNVPANQVYVLYATMESLRGRAAVAARTIGVGDNGSEVDAGRLTAAPGFRVAGRVELTDGKTVPDGTQLFVAREQAPDILEVPLGPGGTFAVTHLPGETLHMAPSLLLEGYRISADSFLANPSTRSVRLPLEQDVSNLAIRLEPE